MKRYAIAFILMCSFIPTAFSFPRDFNIIRKLLRIEIPAESEVLSSFGNAERAALPQKISILVWNLHKLQADQLINDLRILSDDKDLVFSQEAYLSENLLDFLNNTGRFGWVMGKSFLLGKHMTGTGVATGALVAPVETSFFRSSLRELITGTPKIGLSTKYSIENSEKTLLAINVHGVLFVGLTAYHDYLKKIEDDVLKHDGPVILAGDFNSWTSDRGEALEDTIKKLNLKSVEFSPDMRRVTSSGNILDHIYYRGLNLISSRSTGLDTSDHTPMEAEFEVDKNFSN